MRLSLYEIETTTRQASVGAGIPHGLGEDIGKAAAWLAERGHDGVGAALTSIRTGMSKTRIGTLKKGVILFHDPQIAICGPSIIDLLTGEKLCNEIHLQKVDSAVLLFGFAGVTASQHGCMFQFDFSNGTRVQVNGEKVVENGDILDSGFDVIVRCFEENQELSIAPMLLSGLEVSNEIWREMTTLAAKTYVPESNVSRFAGAGADMSDND